MTFVSQFWTAPWIVAKALYLKSGCMLRRLSYSAAIISFIECFCLCMLQFAERIADIRKPEWDNHYLTKWLVGELNKIERKQDICFWLSIHQ